MDSIVIFAFIAAVIWIVRKSYRKAFLDVYVPVMLCLPSWPRWILPELPDPTFQQAAILPIAAVFLFRDWRQYRFSILDPFVFGFVFMVGLSEFINAGYSEAQNLMFDMLASGLIPYVVAKGVLQTLALRVRFVRRFVWCVCLVIVTTLYEVKFSYNPYRLILSPFFPGQGEGWVTSFRYGIPRVAGPYGHAILAGVIFMIALRLQAWLRRSNLWEARFSHFNPGKMSKANVLLGWTFLGLFLTWVRGPQLGTLLAWIVSIITRGKNPRKRMITAAVTLAVTGIPLALWFYSYASIGRAAAVTASQESVAYRKELIDKYLVSAHRHKWFGWGKNGWPKVSSMPSIDNYYLLISLMHGEIALGLFVAILVVSSVRLFRNGVKTAAVDPVSSSLSFDLCGIYLGFGFSVGTVYLGENMIPVFFTLLGFSEAFLLACRDTKNPKIVLVNRQRPKIQTPRFRRVVV